MAEQPTLFSRIIAGEIPADIIYRDSECVAFRDIQPQAPTHLLVVPVAPIPTIAAVDPSQEQLLGHLLAVAARLASESGLDTMGYRLVINHGEHAGQTVPHLHIHVIGGRPLGQMVGAAGDAPHET